MSNVRHAHGGSADAWGGFVGLVDDVNKVTEYSRELLVETKPAAVDLGRAATSAEKGLTKQLTQALVVWLLRLSSLAELNCFPWLNCSLPRDSPVPPGSDDWGRRQDCRHVDKFGHV